MQTTQSTLKFYQSFLLDPNLLANGHALIKAFLLQSQINRQHTLLNILTPSPPVLTLIGNVYPCDVYPFLDQSQRQKTRVFLMQTLWNIISKNGIKSKQSINLLSMIRKIHNQQGYDKWIPLYAQIIKNIQKQQFADFVISILQHADNRISILSINIFSFLMQKITISNQLFLPISTFLQIFYLCIRTFSHMYNTDTQTLQKHYNPYQKYLLTLLWNNISTNTICMKYSFKILTILYGDMNRLQDIQEQQQQQQQINHIKLLLQIGIQLTQQYIKIIDDPYYGGLIQQQQQQQNNFTQIQNNTKTQLYQNIPIILYQYLQLFSILIPALQQHQFQSKISKPNCTSVVICSLLFVLSSKTQQIYWINNTDQYFISIQDQFQRNLRNRATSMLCSLIEDSQDKGKYLNILQEYFSIVGQALVITDNNNNNNNNNNSINSSINLIQNYLNNKLTTTNKITLSNTSLTLSLTNIQQSSYFILTSTISNLFPDSQLPSLLQYLSIRYNKTQSILIKIIILYLIINQLNSNKFINQIQNQLYRFILQKINKQQYVYNKRRQDNGIILVLGRGLGKICSKNRVKIEIGVDVSIGFVEILIGYITNRYININNNNNNNNNNNKPDQDGTYIILQVLLKLSQIHPNNKKILSNYITPQLQNYMINNYMHDGLLSTIVFKLFQLYPYQQIINNLINMLLSGNIVQQKYSNIIVYYLKCQLLILNQQHIILLLQLYKNKISIISSIILLYLSILYKNKIKPSSQNIIQLLNNNYDQIWLVPMLRCGIVQNWLECVSKCIKNILQDITSQYQLQRKMIVIFYMGIWQGQKFIGLLKNYNIFQQFIEKVYRYAKLFQGKNLKTITSLFFIKLSEIQSTLYAKTLDLIEIYGKLEVSQWEDQQVQEEQFMDPIEQLMNCKMENQELEKELEDIFSQFINQNTAVYIEKIKNQLKAKLGK